jgi:hypothetical protein
MFYCIGGAFASCWLLAETRVPPKTTGKTLLFLFSIGNICSAPCSLVAAIGLWEAVLSQIICMVIVILFVFLLPEPGMYSTKMDKQQEKIGGGLG